MLKTLALRKVLNVLMREVVLPATRRVGTVVATALVAYAQANEIELPQDFVQQVAAIGAAVMLILWDFVTSYIDRNKRGL
jgi:DNA-binding GntR family transcriptional regulator